MPGDAIGTRGDPQADHERSRAGHRVLHGNTATRALALLLALALFAAAGCGDEGTDTGPSAGTGTQTTAAPEPGEPTAGTQRCTNEQDGYSVEFPADWQTNSDDPPTCSFFDPEPIMVPERPRDVAGLAAISIRREPVAFSRVTGEDPATRVVERADAEVAGRPAVRRVTESTGEGLLPEGRRSYEYLVDLDGETLIASTLDGGGRDFAANRERLDEMMRSLELQDQP